MNGVGDLQASVGDGALEGAMMVDASARRVATEAVSQRSVHH
jgi:hypothetical protein